MPLIKHIVPFEQTRIGVWHIRESETFFRENLKLNKLEQQQLDTIKGNRKIQWLSARYCLNVLLAEKDDPVCLKDQYGKPFLENRDLHISFSHAADLSAVMISDKLCGVDIQHPVEKIYRIKQKFLSESELGYIREEQELDMLHISWGAKESIYKAWGKKRVEFKTHMILDPYSPDTKLPLKGRFNNGSYQMKFDIFYQQIRNSYLVYVIRNENRERP